MTPKDYIGPLVSLCALLFTILAFWWNNWRLGKILVDTPRSFSIRQRSETLGLLLPLALSNSGARTIVVTALRLNMCTDDGSRLQLSHMRNYESARFEVSTASLAMNFVVEGRGSVMLYAEFCGHSLVRDVSQSDFSITVEALSSSAPDWRQVGTFEIATDAVESLGDSYKFYSNLASLPS